MNFYTQVIRIDKNAHTKNIVSDIHLLEPVTRKTVQAIIAEAKEHGTDFMVFETFRSKERQTVLYNEGVTKLKQVGVHHYGLACDIVLKEGGHPSWDGDFSLLGQLARKHGLIWGGDWGNPNIKHTFIDPYHIQRCSIKKQADLFSGIWYPDENYNPYNE